MSTPLVLRKQVRWKRSFIRVACCDSNVSAQAATSVSGSTFIPQLRTASVDAPARMLNVQQISMAAATSSRKKSVGDLKKADLEGKKVRNQEATS